MPDLRRAVLLLIAVPLAFCSKTETSSSTTSAQTDTTPPPAVANATTATTPPIVTPPATAATAPNSAGIATADGEASGVTAVIKELKRSSGGIVSLKFTIANGSDKQVNFGYDFGDPAHEIPDFGSIGGVQLIDQVGKKKYYVARDSDGKCVCSRGVKDLKAGDSINVWAKFPAPPDDVQKISIVIPHFSPLDDVPISN